MNPHPELTYRLETLAAEQNRRAIELRRSIHERTGVRATRTVRSRLAALWGHARNAASETPASAPSGAHTHAHA